jgi:hypothetical protein
MSKVVTVIQGNIRPGFNEVLHAVQQFSDAVVLSTWRGEQHMVPKGRFELVLSDPPIQQGITNRNMQRVSTVAGLKRAQEIGADFVLKWRTDLLPTNITKKKLLSFVLHKVPQDIPSRLMLSPFRSAAISPDWFSSLPDLYAFGHLDVMCLLWNDSGFDTTQPFNIPPGMLQLPGLEVSPDQLLVNGHDFTAFYDAHIECWAWFKYNLQRCLEREISFNEVAANYLSMPDHHRLRICWFGGDNKAFRPYRSIAQATGRPWATEKLWRIGQLPIPVPVEEWYGKRFSKWSNLRNNFNIQSEIMCQRFWHWRYHKSLSHS